MENTNYRWVKENPPKGKQNADPGKVKKAALFAIAAVFAVLLVFTSFYTVDDKQQAVVTTFGKVSDITQPGLHFKIPFGIQQVHKVDVNVYQKIELGYITDEEGHAVTKTNESAMITGDYNIVNVDFFVEYKISDPVAFLFHSTDPEMILRNLIQSQVRNVVGSAAVDSVLTDGKEGIQSQVKELVAEILSEYDIGLTLALGGIYNGVTEEYSNVLAFGAVAGTNDTVSFVNVSRRANSIVPFARSR